MSQSSFQPTSALSQNNEAAEEIKPNLNTLGPSSVASHHSSQLNPPSIMPITPKSIQSTMSSITDSITPALQNIVATVNLCCKLDLRKIAQGARNAEYNPKRFAAVIMRIREPRTTALVFSSGKLVITGAKSEDAAKLAARKYARVIQKLSFPAKFAEFKIQNMVGSCDVKFPIRLEGLMLMHGQFCSYEPELFPGFTEWSNPELCYSYLYRAKW